MADEIKVVKTTGLGQNFLSSMVGALIGILFFFGSFVLLYWNEGRADLSLLATKAIAIPADEAPPVAASGKLVSISGLFTTPEKISDGLYLQKSPYLALKREVEMFAWEESEETETGKNPGGSTTTTTTYRYKKNWTAYPKNSDNFKESAGHVNPAMPLTSQEFRATKGLVGKYGFELKTVELPPLTRMILTAERVRLRDNTVIANEGYLFRGQGSYAEPMVGDIRVRYEVLEPGFTGTLFGKLANTQVTAYRDEEGELLFHLFDVDRDSAIVQLHQDYVFETWLFRGLGFVAMWLGLGLFIEPLFTLFDIVPMVGTVTRAIASVISFGMALLLSLVTVLVSMLLHSLVALIIALVLTSGVIVTVLIMKKKHPAA